MQHGDVTLAAGEVFSFGATPALPVQVNENETVSLTFSEPSSGAVLGTQKKATLTIIGND